MDYNAKIAQQGGQWVVGFPDCPGCATYGNTKKEAVAMAADALDGWLEVSLEHGDVPPRPKARGNLKVQVAPRLAIAIALRWLRSDLGLNQRELAKRVGVTQQAIAKLENRGANPTIETLEKIAGKLGADVVVTFEPRPAKTSRAR